MCWRGRRIICRGRRWQARYLIQEGFLQKIGELYRHYESGQKSLR